MRRLPIALVLLLQVPAVAQIPWCGTGGATSQRAAAIGKWVAAREAARLGKGGDPIASVSDSIVVLQSDDRNTPFRRPFDLAGRSLVFTPSNGGYRASNVPLIWDDGISTALTVTGSTYPARAAHALPFAFPFGGRNVTQLFAANDNALYLDAPPPGNVQGQYLDLDLATTSAATISPLLMPQLAFGFDQPPAAIAFHDTSTSSTFTWTSTGTRSRYEVQATLFADGAIRFSYRSAERVPAGAVVVTSGAESWRSQKAEIARIPDPAGDATGPPADVLPSLDIRSVDVDRIADSNLLELRIELGAAPDRGKLSEDALYTVDIAGFDVILRTTLSRDGSRDEYFVPINGSLAFGTAARIEGNAIVMDFLEEMLPPPWTAVPMTISTRFGRTLAPADSVTKLLSFSPPARGVATDFSSITGDVQMNGPIAEAFTLPVLNPEGTWEELKALYGLNDSSFDGVAIYQNFDTDLTLTFISAYSTIGNAEASGLSFQPEIGANQPRFPALLHLDTIATAQRAGETFAVQATMHELGHRWLFYARFNDAGKISYDLNPSFGGHPAAYVSEPAAFPVLTSGESSVMGGSRFTENADGSFTTPATFVSYGFSWLDLYFMGLAGASEVEPFFYIANSSPALASDYWPPPKLRVTGAKKRVTMQQVLEAMGPRLPAYPETQREFRLLTVLLTDPSHAATAEELATLQGI
ncbi:MAG TPA: hypothetical protein VN605_04140, partial [Thermoanaerobaculia bacterium]|nr:hypothetical protein [Thermoanaerobaculia bacterium]